MEYAGKSPELWAAIKNEEQRQQETIELIASENIVSKEVREAQGSVLTNKYAEGYPGKRYYGGCQYIDQVEQLAIDYAKKFFGAEYANVQPHSGSQANMAVYQALLKPGDKILGMGMDAGGPASVTTYDKAVLLKAVLDGEINPGKVFTKTFTLDQIQDAYKAMDDRQVIKSYVVID